MERTGDRLRIALMTYNSRSAADGLGLDLIVSKYKLQGYRVGRCCLGILSGLVPADRTDLKPL